MKITDLLKRESVELSGKPESKGQAIDQMVEQMAKRGKINDLQVRRHFSPGWHPERIL